MQATPQTPLHLTPGAILASPQGRGTITIVSVTESRVTYLDDTQCWTWSRRSTERVLSGMGFTVVGQEDPAVLAERVRLAQATYRARRAA